MNINFEQDKQDSLTKVNDAKSLSEQVVKLQSMEEDLAKQEERVKKIKKDIKKKCIAAYCCFYWDCNSPFNVIFST